MDEMVGMVLQVLKDPQAGTGGMEWSDHRAPGETLVRPQGLWVHREIRDPQDYRVSLAYREIRGPLAYRVYREIRDLQAFKVPKD